jgi:DNA-directed RNA polymerase subunit alpha
MVAEDARKLEMVRYTFGPSEDRGRPERLPHSSNPRREPMSLTRIPLSRQDENARLMKERLEMSTAEIGLSVRTTNCLEERGIFTVRDLLNSSPEQLLSIANFGEKTLEEVYKALEKFGFYRKSRQKMVAV